MRSTSFSPDVRILRELMPPGRAKKAVLHTRNSYKKVPIIKKPNIQLPKLKETSVQVKIPIEGIETNYNEKSLRPYKTVSPSDTPRHSSSMSKFKRNLKNTNGSVPKSIDIRSKLLPSLNPVKNVKIIKQYKKFATFNTKRKAVLVNFSKKSSTKNDCNN